MDLEAVWPPFALRLQCGDMELSPVREADLPELAAIAKGGIRHGSFPAFLVDWDSGSDEQIARNLAQYHWSTRADWSVDNWTIEFTVRVSGRAIGIQGVSADRFPLSRTVSTGSWLATTAQGQGYGTLMRRIIISAFISEFGAVRFDTGYVEGNEASRRVSEKLGYSPNGNRTIIVQDRHAHTEHCMTLHADNFTNSTPAITVTGAVPVRQFLGLDR